MGLLSKIAGAVPKADFPYTEVHIVSLADDRCTVINIIDPIYSINGSIVHTVELESFDGPFALVYMQIVKLYLQLAIDVEKRVRAGRIC